MTRQRAVKGDPPFGLPAPNDATEDSSRAVASGAHRGILLTMSEAARTLQVSRSSLYEEVRRRRLRVVKIGHLTRIRPAELDRYVLQQECEGIP
jgi:excisionase family DNA binding protein